MKIEEMKDAYNAYSEEDNIRKELLEAILNRKNSLLYQQQFIDSFNKTNNELYLIINKTNDEELQSIVYQTMNNPDYKDLTNFFLILNGYSQLKSNSNNAQKFSERKNLLYFELLKWFIPNHGLSNKDKDELVNEFITTTADSIGIRNILANKEDYNSVFDNILIIDDFERKLAIDAFVSEVDLILAIINVFFIKSIHIGSSYYVPKSLVLRLVLMNLLTKEYQLGFRIEEYVSRFFNNFDLEKACSSKGINVTKSEIDLFMKKLNNYVEELLIEINDITNEYNNYKEKRKTI